jgi:glycosyltransferase involved in cell wall biosynthesis
MVDKIVTVSTKANGGIRSVVENYENCGLFEGIEHTWICSHKNVGLINRQLLFLKSLCLVLFARIRGAKIFHIHMAMKGSFFRKLIISNILKFFQSVVIIHLHGSEFKDFYKSSSFKEWIIKLFQRADRVIVLSESWKAFVENIAPEAKVTVVNNYVAEIKKEEVDKDSDFIFLFLGAIGKRKGIFDLLAAFENLYKKNKNIRLYIAGNDDANVLPEIIEGLECSDKIRFFGWIDYQEKTNLLNVSDCLILPSYNEGLPMVILEAMSANVPVISTYVGGIPEVIKHGENGFLLRPGNIQDIELMMEKIQNEKFLTEFANKSYKLYINKFSPQAILPKLKQIYMEVDNEQ